MSVNSDLAGTCNLHKITFQYMIIRERSYVITRDFERKNLCQAAVHSLRSENRDTDVPLKSREGCFSKFDITMFSESSGNPSIAS